MRVRIVAFVLSGIVGGLPASPALADHGPNYVIPGRPDVPVIINGFNAAWGVVESDWGLYRPGHLAPTVIPAPFTPPQPRARRWFPSLGGLPHSGRLEVEPPANRQLPTPAPSYHRSWESSSDPLPATEYAPSPADQRGDNADLQLDRGRNGAHRDMVSPEIDVGRRRHNKIDVGRRRHNKKSHP